MSAFSPMHWAITAVIVAAILYGLWHAGKWIVSIVSWVSRRRSQ